MWLLAGLYFACADGPSDVTLATINFFGPIIFAGILFASAFVAARRQRRQLFLAPFWFRVSAGIYFGVGNLIEYFASPETMIYIWSFFSYSGDELLKVNFVNAVSAACVLSGLRFAAAIFRNGVSVRLPNALDLTNGGGSSLGRVALFFAFIGFVSKYTLILPWQFGAYGSIVLSGWVISLNLIPPVAIFMTSMWAAKRRFATIALPVVLVALECLSGVLLGSKSVIITAALMSVLGYLAVNFSIRGLVAGTACLGAIFALTVPVTDYVRVQVNTSSSLQGEIGLGERLEFVGDFLNTEAISGAGGVQGVIVRLSYANQAAFAVSEFDLGRPGDSYRDWLAAPVPRFLWSDKPNLSLVGVEFNDRATGNPFSSSSPGLFAEAYWNFGWTGVWLTMFVYGAILFGLGRYGFWVLERSNWWHLPIALLAMRIGMRTDGMFVIDVIGPLSTILVLHVLVTVGVPMIGSSGQSRNALGGVR